MLDNAHLDKFFVVEVAWCLQHVNYSYILRQFAHTQQTIPSYTETFWKTNEQRNKLRIHNIIAIAALKFGSEACVLKKREEQRLEAAQIKFLKHLLGITKLDQEKNQCIGGKREHRTS
jgi:hypothetical protein